MSANDIEKIIAINNATLVSNYNIDRIIEKCYNWIIRVNATNLKIVEGKHILDRIITYGTVKYGTVKYGEVATKDVIYDKIVNVGDNINAETEYLGIVSGKIIKQSFNLNGNIIIKEAVLK